MTAICCVSVFLFKFKFGFLAHIIFFLFEVKQVFRAKIIRAKTNQPVCRPFDRQAVSQAISITALYCCCWLPLEKPQLNVPKSHTRMKLVWHKHNANWLAGSLLAGWMDDWLAGYLDCTTHNKEKDIHQPTRQTDIETDRRQSASYI